MARPVDWQPLAESDPTPGDPAGISAEAAHLSSMAQQIASQVTILRRIAASQSDEKGEHADKLKSAASDTADQLDNVTARYQETAAALRAWVPELEYAQSQSKTALDQAQDAARRKQANQPFRPPPGHHMTEGEHQDNEDRLRASRQADDDLAAARAMLDSAVSHWDQKGSETASKIESASSHDKDSFWDDIGFTSALDWLGDHWVPLLKDICTVLEALALIIMVVALFIPGLNILDALLMAAFVATLLATVGRGVLAATGNGSWLEFGMDVLSLVTLGAGRFLGAGLKAAAMGAEETGQGLVASERAATASEYMEKYFGSTAGRVIGEGKAAELSAQWAAEHVPDLALEGEKATGLGNFLKAGGEMENLEHFQKVATVYDRFSSSPEMSATMDRAHALFTAARINSYADLGHSLVDATKGGEWVGMDDQPVAHWGVPGISDGFTWLNEHTTHALPGFSMASGGEG